MPERKEGRELCGPGRKRADSSRHYDPPRCEFFAIRHDNLEPARGEVDAAHLALFKISYRLALIPMPVVYKTVERDWPGDVISPFAAVSIERQSLVGIGDVRSAPIRAQTHAHRHLVLPERHGFAENARFDSSRVQIGCRGKSVRTGAHHYYIAI